MSVHRRRVPSLCVHPPSGSQPCIVLLYVQYLSCRPLVVPCDASRGRHSPCPLVQPGLINRPSSSVLPFRHCTLPLLHSTSSSTQRPNTAVWHSTRSYPSKSIDTPSNLPFTANMRTTFAFAVLAAIGAQAVPQGVQPISQISDGQIQAPPATAAPVSSYAPVAPSVSHGT